MRKGRNNTRGFALIAALLLTILLSGVALGLLYMVSNEARMGGADLEGNLAYYGAEAGMENLTSQLSQLYQNSQTPGAAAICALLSNNPTGVSGANITNINYTQVISWPPNVSSTTCPTTNPTTSWDIVGAGPNQGMVASMIPFTLNVTATRQASVGQVSANSASAATGASVNMTRTVEVALLPAFEFGIFCQYDCDYFAGPVFNFGGRVHTNGNLFLASGSTLAFSDKIAAANQVILDQLENGWPTSNGYTGAIYVPNASGGCAGGVGTSTCPQLTAGSWTGGFPPTGAANPGWTSISTSTFNGFIKNGLTGASVLTLPFMQSSKVGAIDIIRRPTPGDSPQLLNSRLYSNAEIRILLADTQAELHPDRPSLSDGQDIQLTGSYPLTAGAYSGSNMYFGMAQSGSGNWVVPTSCPGLATWPLLGEVTQSGSTCQSVWLRVEYCTSASTCANSSGAWVGVTTQWLGYGFGRPYGVSPSTPYGGAGANPLGPAILILQQLQSGVGNASAVGAASTANNWLPINLYDSREGEPREGRSASNTTACGPIGVVNVVELDVGNLWLWLQGAAPYGGGSGASVNSTTQNGYIVYFSDQRGMLPDAHPLTAYYSPGLSGVSGLEDTVNATSSTGVPDGVLEPATYYSYSPEDVDDNNFLDNWGQAHLGDGFGVAAGSMAQPYFISGTTTGIACNSGGAPAIAAWNMVTGPRHALRLVDGGMNGAQTTYLPHPANTTSYGYGFTVASEEPVYIWGNYNSDSSDPFWATPNPTNAAAALHSAAAIIADAVTLLSPDWADANSFLSPCAASAGLANCSTTGRVETAAHPSYYRVAIAAGKSIPFPEPGWASAAGLKDFGTDGGMHNFLRYLEDRSASTVYFNGSMISMYYSQYATGIFKCCGTVYQPPTRQYYFDTQFENPNNLPPGTPMFQDVVSLSYHESFAPE